MLSVASRRPKYRVSPTTPTISYASSLLKIRSVGMWLIGVTRSHCGFQGYFVPQLFQALHQALGESLSIETVEIIHAQVLVLFPAYLQNVAGHQQRVRHRHDRSFLSFARRQPMVERFVVRAFGDAGPPGGLRQSPPQPNVALW